MRETPASVTIRIRPAELRDVGAIRSIDARVYPSPWSEALTVEQVTGRGRVHRVVEDGCEVVAHAGIALLDGEAHITTIAVDPACQRRGIGSSVLAHLLVAARRSGCTAATLEVRASNTSAIALYEKHGFEVAGMRPGYYANTSEDALIMWLHHLPDP